MSTDVIPPGSTICILGGGQLGKMSAQAAQQLGYYVMVWSDKEDAPATDVTDNSIICPYNQDLVEEIASTADVVTTEWENVPLELIKKLEDQGVPVRPSSKILEIAQNRWAEKQMAQGRGVLTTKTLHLPTNEKEYSSYLPGIVKATKNGYDGKGQIPVESIEDVNKALKKLNTDCILEKRVPFKAECSILVARSPSGEISISNVVENTHENGILSTSIWPARHLSAHVSIRASNMAMKMTKYMQFEGVMVFEFFVTQDEDVLFNEMAPRPHNSFHGSIEAANTSQFEQHIRSICNLPLGRVQFHTPFKMTNLLGGDWSVWSKHLTSNSANLHVYGKGKSAEGRKMGHVTKLNPNSF